MVGRKWFIPWLWLSPALIILGIFLVYPTLDTLRLSFMNRNSTQFEGLSNYTYVLTQPTTQSAILNNLLWLVLLPVSQWDWASSLRYCSIPCAMSGTCKRPFSSQWQFRSSLPV